MKKKKLWNYLYFARAGEMQTSCKADNIYSKVSIYSNHCVFLDCWTCNKWNGKCYLLEKWIKMMMAISSKHFVKQNPNQTNKIM